MSPDFKTRTGCSNYVETVVLPQVVRTISQTRKLPPLGIVFATLINGVAQDPVATPVNTPPRGGREIRRMMQRVVGSTCAIGSIYVRQDEFVTQGGEDIDAVVVQLEHKTFGDLVWTASVRKGGSLGPWVGPVDLNKSPVRVSALRFLANRWMS